MNIQNYEKKAFNYHNGGYHCAEAVLKTVVEDFFKESFPGIPRAASVFQAGIAGTKEDLCGALAGGLIALGFLYGRTEKDADIQMAKDVASEFRKRCINGFGSTRCGEILDTLGPQENSMKCKQLSGTTTGMLLKLLEEDGLNDKKNV